jgi:hypothetical protein
LLLSISGWKARQASACDANKGDILPPASLTNTCVLDIPRAGFSQAAYVPAKKTTHINADKAVLTGRRRHATANNTPTPDSIPARWNQTGDCP